METGEDEQERKSEKTVSTRPSLQQTRSETNGILRVLVDDKMVMERGKTETLLLLAKQKRETENPENRQQTKTKK